MMWNGNLYFAASKQDQWHTRLRVDRFLDSIEASPLLCLSKTSPHVSPLHVR
jgi:hypothetical protein